MKTLCGKYGVDRDNKSDSQKRKYGICEKCFFCGKGKNEKTISIIKSCYEVLGTPRESRLVNPEVLLN